MHHSLPHNHYCCSLPSPICLLHLVICIYPNSSPISPLLLLYVFILFLYVMLLLLLLFYWYIAWLIAMMLMANVVMGGSTDSLMLFLCLCIFCCYYVFNCTLLPVFFQSFFDNFHSDEYLACLLSSLLYIWLICIVFPIFIFHLYFVATYIQSLRILCLWTMYFHGVYLLTVHPHTSFFVINLVIHSIVHGPWDGPSNYATITKTSALMMMNLMFYLCYMPKNYSRLGSGCAVPG